MSYDPTQPRDEYGRWTKGDGFNLKAGTEKKWLHTPRSDIFSNLMKPDGGFTIHAVTGRETKTGYAVSIFPHRSLATTIHEVTPMSLGAYMMKNRDLLTQKINQFGGWHDPETGAIFLDVSRRVSTQAEATALALKHDQKSIFDFANGRSIKVNAHATSGGQI
jgi:hypothetical protein